MDRELLHDRGRGPEVRGTRITIHTLLPYFLDPTATEGYLCKLYRLTPEQVAAARAYILEHYEEVLTEHRRIEARLSAGNPPEVEARTEKVRTAFEEFRARQKERPGNERPRPSPGPDDDTASPVPTFREWFAEQEARKGAEGLR